MSVPLAVSFRIAAGYHGSTDSAARGRRGGVPPLRRALGGTPPRCPFRAAARPRSRAFFAGHLDAFVSSLEAMPCAWLLVRPMSLMSKSREVTKMLRRSMVRRSLFALLTLALVAVGFQGAFAQGAQDRGRALGLPGLDPRARNELASAGVNKYVGQFHPSASEQIGEWTKYTFDTQGGDGPICIAGTELSVFNQQRDPKKVMVILDGGGACWQGFYFCSITADS